MNWQLGSLRGKKKSKRSQDSREGSEGKKDLRKENQSIKRPRLPDWLERVGSWRSAKSKSRSGRSLNKGKGYE